ncbi:response regulator transcription factor [Niastella vici]|uniref:response regulator transcription factor n=1 Tax=Niastella vici TaxID=1703345 RepID=UPI0009C00C13|nr:helix-turn-helix transcriptional regulator [Niastella vici]
MPRLTHREKQVIQLLSEGKTSLQIGKELSVSALTIDTHRRNLMQKFAAKNTAELIKTAMLHRFI